MSSPAAPPPAATALLASPVPYQFGVLAGMLGLTLIMLAVIILACSYWNLNNYVGTGHATTTSSSSRSGATNGDRSKSPAAPPATFAELVAVVMAREKMPTFLAAPMVRRAHGNGAPATATGGGSPETEEQESRGKAGERENGVVGDAERERQQDQV